MKAVRDRAAFTTAATESTHLQQMMIEENLVVTQMVIIPNHAPATNKPWVPYRGYPVWPDLARIHAKLAGGTAYPERSIPDVSLVRASSCGVAYGQSWGFSRDDSYFGTGATCIRSRSFNHNGDGGSGNAFNASCTARRSCGACAMAML